MSIDASIIALALFLIFIPLMLTFVMYPFYNKSETSFLLISFSIFCLITIYTGELWGFILLTFIAWIVAINSVVHVRSDKKIRF